MKLLALTCLLIITNLQITNATDSTLGKRNWTVWYKTCPAYVNPVMKNTKPVKEFEKGATVQGYKYHKSSDGIEWIAIKDGENFLFLPFAYLTHIPDENNIEKNLEFGKEKVDRWNALPADYKPDDLVTIPGKYCYNTIEHRLRKEPAQALQDMINAAKREKITIRVISSYRSYDWQKSKFSAKIKKDGLQQRVSAKPGHSEHQLGTTIDLVGTDSKTILEQSFAQTKEGKWLKKNSTRFGFTISYTKENQKQTGYIPEPWHLRYTGTLK